MIDKLVDQFDKELTKFVDELAKNLIRQAGYTISEKPGEFELMTLADQMKKDGYIIRTQKSVAGREMVALYKLGDLHEDLIGGYELDFRSEENGVKLFAIQFE